MNAKKYDSIFRVFLISIVAFSAHKLFFFLNENNPKFQNFHFSIEAIYGFFFFCTVIILLILIKVKSINIDNVGHTFLLLTCIKMAISYVVLLPILHSGNQNIEIEKLNFFLIFALFLATETIITIRILNNN